MTERDLLLKKIQSIQFAAHELKLFLDTHPNDSQAIKSFRKYHEQLKQLIDEYQRKYGPLFPSDSYGDLSWDWINSPWPWEIDREMR